MPASVLEFSSFTLLGFIKTGPACWDLADKTLISYGHKIERNVPAVAQPGQSRIRLLTYGVAISNQSDSRLPARYILVGQVIRFLTQAQMRPHFNHVLAAGLAERVGEPGQNIRKQYRILP
eukprot:g6183.t1